MSRRRTLLALIALALLPVSGWAQGIPAAVTDSSFREFLKQFESATLQMFEADATAWRALESHAADVTLLSPSCSTAGASVPVRTRCGRR